MESTEIPTKSSNEILTELFGVFNAEPPKIVLKTKRKTNSEERDSKHGKKVKKSKSEKTKKKHKHKHKHKKHKKKRSDSEDESESDSHNNNKKSKTKDDDDDGKEVTSSGSVSVNIELPVDKVPMALEIMLDGTVGIKGEDGVITKIPDVCDNSVNDVETGVVESEKSVNGIVSSSELESCHVQTEGNKTDSGADCERKIPDESKEKQSETVDRQKKGKIQIKDLKFSSVYQETIKAIEEEKKKKEQKKAEIEEGELVESSNDEENVEKEGEGRYDKSGEEHSKHKHRHSKYHRRNSDVEYHKKQRSKSSKLNSRSRSRSRSSHRSHDRHRSHHHSSHKRHRSRSREHSSNHSRDRRRSPSSHRSSSGWSKYSNHRSRSRSHRSDRSTDRKSKGNSRERSRSLEDKSVEKIDKDKLLEIARKNALKLIGKGVVPGGEEKVTAIKAGGKTVNELTAYCKKLSEKEALEGDLSDIVSDSSDDEDKPFHHPFRVRDRPNAIVMNIKNSTPIPIKTLQEKAAEQAKQLRLQFPVSSGTSHRRSENEWVPVSPKKEQAPVTQPIAAPTPAPMPTPTPTPTPTPMPTPTPVPMPVPAPTFVPPLVPMPVQTPVPQPQLPVKSVPPPQPLMPPVMPTMPMYMTKMPPPGPVFPVVRPDIPKMDISSIVSKRIEAIRKLQENPNDPQALHQMYSAQQEMQFWAESKHEPGAFTGSTGVRVLSASELNSGTQAWARRNQLTNATPVSGGMGMAMLQKMGWQPGEGLGKNKEGTLEPLRLEVKTDKKGLLAPDEFKRNRKGPVVQPKPPLPTVKSLEGKHPVSLLTELCSRRRYGVPQFELCFECGPDHRKNFLFKVRVNGIEYTPSVASPNKKQAKAEAAAVCLRALGIISDKPTT